LEYGHPTLFVLGRATPAGYAAGYAKFGLSKSNFSSESARQDVLHPVEDSPVRFEIMRETVKHGGNRPLKQMIPTLMAINQSL